MDLSDAFPYGTDCPGVNASNISSALMAWGADGYGDSDGNATALFKACNCTTWNSDTKDAAYISGIRIVTSFFSVIGSASIILLVLLTGKLNTAEVHPLFILSVGDFILSILWLIGGVVWLSPDANGWAKSNSASHTGMCYVLAVATTMAEIVTFFLTVVYAQSALLRIREYYVNKGKPLAEKDRKKRFRYILTGISYILSWLFPLVLVLAVTEGNIGIETTDQGCWCIVDFFNLRPDNGDLSRDSVFNHFAIVQASIIGPVFAFTSILIIIYYIMTFWYAMKVSALQSQRGYQQQRLQHRPSKPQQMIKTVMVRLSFFVLIFIVCGGPSFAGAIAVWAERDRLHISETPDRVILYLHAIVAPMQGFWNAIVYGWSRKEFRKAVKLHNRIKISQSGRQAPQYESLNNSRVPPGNLNVPNN